MRLGRKFGRSDEMRPLNRKNRAVLNDAVQAAIEKLEPRQLMSTTVFNFNTGATDVSSNFLVNLDGVKSAPSATMFNWNATAGVSDNAGNPGGGVQDGTAEAALVDGKTGYNVSDPAGATVSAMFKMPATINTGKWSQVGFSSQEDSSFNTDNNATSLANIPAWIGIRPYGNGELEVQYKNNGTFAAAATTAVVTGGANLNASDWYNVTFTLTETAPGSNSFNYSAKLDDWGTAGTAFVSTRSSFTSTAPVTINGFNGAGSSGADLGWALVRQTGYAVNMDNFTVTGTPVAMTAPTLAGLAGPPITLSWNATNGGEYNVLRGTTSGGETFLKTVDDAITFTDTTAAQGVTYYYEVQPIDTSGAGPISNEINLFAPVNAPPAAVTNLAGAASPTQVTLNWDPSITGATSYKVLRAPFDNLTKVTGSYVQISPAGSPTNPTYVDTTVVAGNFYSYEIVATNSFGDAPASAAAVVLVSGPTTNTVTFNNPATTTITYGNGLTLAGVEVDEANNFIVDHDGTVLSPGFNVNATNLVANQNFQWNAQAGVQDGPGGAVAGGLLTQPTSAGADENLNYAAHSYNVAAAGGATISWMFEETSGQAANSRIGQIGFGNLLNSSFNGDANGGAPTPSTTPAGTAFFGIRPYTNGQLELQSKATAGAGVVNSTVVPGNIPLVTGEWYQLSFTMTETAPGSGSFTWSTTLQDYGTSGTALVAGSPSNSTTSSGTSSVAIAGFNAASGSGPDVVWAGIRQATDAPNIDNVTITGTYSAVGPTAPTASAIANHNVALVSWTTSPGAVSYNIFRSSGAGGAGQETILQTGVTGLSFSDTTVTDGTQYFYKVEPISGGSAAGNLSNEVTVTPSASAPVAPTGLTITSAQNGNVVLVWNPSNFAASYKVMRAPVTNGTVGVFAQIGTTTTPTTTFSDNATTDPSSPPSAPNVYAYEVIAVNATGSSLASNVVQANFLNGAEQFLYNNQWWKSSDQSTTGYKKPSLSPDVSQLAASVNFTGNSNVPGVGIPNVNFSQIITGKIIVNPSDLGLAAGDTTDTANISFEIINDDDSYLMFGGHLVASDVGSTTTLVGLNSTGTTSGQVVSLSIHAGQYDFAFFEHQAAGNWSAVMDWSRPGNTAYSPVPQTNLVVRTGAPAAPQDLFASTATDGAHLGWTNNAGNELEELVQRSTTSDFSSNVLTVGTLAANNVDEFTTGSQNLAAFTDASNNGAVPTWYRIVSANLDGTAPSNIVAVPTFPTSPGLEVHGYNNLWWNSATQAAGAEATSGPSLTSFDVSGSLAQEDTGGVSNNSTLTAGSGPTYNGVTLGATNFSSVFTGLLQITQSGTYTFQSNTDDRGILYINDTQVVASNVNTQSGTIPLTAGTNYNIAYFVNQGTGPWIYDLQYSGPDTSNTLQEVNTFPAYEFTEAEQLPGVVTGFAAVSPDSGHVNLSWTAHHDGTLEYVIQRSTDPTFATGVTTLAAGLTANSLVDTTAAPGTAYFYRIQAANFEGSSAFSANVPVTTSTTLSAPTNVTTQQGALNNIVKFNYNLAAVGLNSFTILRSTNGGAFSTVTTTAPATSTTYVDSTITTAPGTTFQYEVQANATSPEVSSAASVASASETLLPVTGTTATPLTSSATAPLSLNGGVTLNPVDGIKLTDGGVNETRSAFGTSGFPVTSSFSTSFDYQATMPDATPADAGNGFAFVLESNSATAIGGGGTGLGYTGANLNNSLAIGFNMFNNVTQVGIATNGGAPSYADLSTATQGLAANPFHILSTGTAPNQTDIFHISISYNNLSNILNLTIKDSGSANTGGAGTATYTANFPMASHGGSPAALLANGGAWAYAGFTGATTAQTSTQVITNWNFAATQTSAAPNLAPLTFSDGEDAGTTQRSEVRKIIFNFDSAVANFPLSALSLSVRNTGGSGTSAGAAFTSTTPAGGNVDGATLTSATSTLTSSNGGLTWTLTFVPSSSVYIDSSGSLNDGIYDLAINASLITNSGNTAMAGGNQTVTFHRLFGDVDGNKGVANSDLNKLKQTFGLGPAAPTYNAGFDTTGTGQVISNGALNNFKKRFGEQFSYT